MFSIAPVVAASIFLAIALAARITDANKILNIADYASVSNIADFHCVAGKRLMILPLISSTLVLLSLQKSGYTLVCFSLFVLSDIFVAIWLATYSSQFPRDEFNH